MAQIRYFLAFLLIVLINNAQANSSDLLTSFYNVPQSKFGVKASNKKVVELAKNIAAPKLSDSGKSYLTANRTGFDVLNTAASMNSWVLAEFFESIKGAKKPILDIGAGYGNISLQALAQGNTVIANDIAVEHVLNINKFAQQRGLPQEKLFLNINSFPHDTNFPAKSLSAVMLHRVLHFMNPAQITEGFAKINKWLVPGGKVFIVVMAPQHKDFSDWFLPIYEQKWSQGDKWPGVDLPIEKALPDQAYNLPKFLHVMDERPLKLALEDNGFYIEKSDFVSMKHFGGHKNKRDGKEAIGIIAVKK